MFLFYLIYMFDHVFLIEKKRFNVYVIIKIQTIVSFENVVEDFVMFDSLSFANTSLFFLVFFFLYVTHIEKVTSGKNQFYLIKKKMIHHQTCSFFFPIRIDQVGKDFFPI